MPPVEAQASPPAPAPAPADGARCHGRAFGLQLDSGFAARGLLESNRGTDPDGRLAGHLRASSLDVVSRKALDAAWPRDEARLLRDVRGRDDRLLLTVEEHPEAGFVLHAPEYGRYQVARDGSRVLCAPSDVSPWEWQAFLIGQILPLAAVLQGLETVHGSAVAFGDRAIGLVGDSRGGKSSLAVNLVRRGAAFVADDVLALERAGERILVHAGPALASVRHAEARAIGPAALERLGPVVGRDEHELRLAMQREPRSRALAALYFVQRSDTEPASAVHQLVPDARLLLGSSFNGIVRTPARRVAQLDLYARLAGAVPIFRAIISPGVDAYGLAGSIRAHASTVIASAA